jgi:hypothetical protein
MKKMMCLAVFAMAMSIGLKAQSVTSPLVVSKGVQQIANKNSLDNEEFKRSNIQVFSRAFPAPVVSKGIVRSTDTGSQGNIVSKGYPTWAISKGVARQNQERVQSSPTLKDNTERSLPGDQISRK